MCTELTVCGVGGGAWWARSSVLDMVLAATFAVAERGQKRAELLLDLMEPASPCDIEKATKRDPIVLSPAGKFQRILNAAE